MLIGLYVAKFLEKVLGKMMHTSNVDASLVYFIKGLIGALLKTLVIITFLGMVGVQVTSFIALLGALGLAVGMALSGTLQNFAGGVIILVFKPFKIGDFNVIRLACCEVSLSIDPLNFSDSIFFNSV